MMAYELKSCPWCQGTELRSPWQDVFEKWIVGCETCGAEGPQSETAINAITAWNTRPTPSVSEDKVAVSDGLVEEIWAPLAHGDDDHREWLKDKIRELTLPIIHRRERQAAEARWQPIETAPRDGTPFIAALTVRNIKTGQSWQETHVIWSDDETDEIANECERGWSRVDDYEWWMPIPAIRSTEVGKGAQ